MSGETDPGCFLADLPPTRRLVLYAEGEVSSLPEPSRRFRGEISVLQGGFKAFSDEILTEPLVPDNPRPEDIERFLLVSAMHAHFTGSRLDKVPVEPSVKPVKIDRAPKKGGGC